MLKNTKYNIFITFYQMCACVFDDLSCSSFAVAHLFSNNFVLLCWSQQISTAAATNTTRQSCRRKGERLRRTSGRSKRRIKLRANCQSPVKLLTAISAQFLPIEIRTFRDVFQKMSFPIQIFLKKSFYKGIICNIKEFFCRRPLFH